MITGYNNIPFLVFEVRVTTYIRQKYRHQLTDDRLTYPTAANEHVFGFSVPKIKFKHYTFSSIM